MRLLSGALVLCAGSAMAQGTAILSIPATSIPATVTGLAPGPAGPAGPIGPAGPAGPAGSGGSVSITDGVTTVGNVTTVRLGTGFKVTSSAVGIATIEFVMPMPVPEISLDGSTWYKWTGSAWVVALPP